MYLLSGSQESLLHIIYVVGCPQVSGKLRASPAPKAYNLLAQGAVYLWPMINICYICPACSVTGFAAVDYISILLRAKPGWCCFNLLSGCRMGKAPQHRGPDPMAPRAICCQPLPRRHLTGISSFLQRSECMSLAFLEAAGLLFRPP